jgi:Zn-dependent protease
MDFSDLITKIPVLLFALTIHEYAHGKAAFSLGDPTSRNARRLTLNPVSHIDPLGALSLFLFNFGWAKPVPINPLYFKSPRRDMVLVSLCGPLSNLLAAFLTGLCIRYLFFPSSTYLALMLDMLLMNIGLGLFNLVPLPPLDGSHVLGNMLPQRSAEKFRRIERYAPLVLIGVLLADRFLRTRIFSTLLGEPIFYLAYSFGGDNFIRILRMAG